MINTKHFDPTLLKIDKKSFKGIGIYNIGYITTKKIDGCKNTHSVNPLYLLIDHANILKKNLQINTSFLTVQMKVMSY